jgi:hypothetical protein
MSKQERLSLKGGAVKASPDVLTNRRRQDAVAGFLDLLARLIADAHLTKCAESQDSQVRESHTQSKNGKGGDGATHKRNTE